MSRVLMINPGWEQQPLVERLHRQGAELYGVSGEETIEHAQWYREVIKAEPRELEAILEYARRLRPDAVLSDQCDYSAFAQAVVCEALGLPGPTIEQQQISVNKALQRERSRRTGVPIPEYTLCTRFEDVRHHTEKYGYPLVLKPVDNRGSFGVNRVDSPGGLQHGWHDALVNSHSRTVLAEEFVEGIHITIDGYAFPDSGPKSLALATKGMLGSDRQVAMDILYPGELAPDLYEKAMRHNEEVNRLLGYSFGMLHTEYMVTPAGELVLIEAANRGGGVFTSEVIVPAVSGIDLLGQYVADALGSGEVAEHGEVQRNQTLLTFFSFPPGKLRAIHGAEKLELDPRVLRYRFAVQPGDEISPVSTDANRHGFMILQDPGDIRATARELKEQIKPEYA